MLMMLKVNLNRNTKLYKVKPQKKVESIMNKAAKEDVEPKQNR